MASFGLLISLMAAFGAQAAAPSATSSGHSARKLVVVSYNIKGLPSLLLGGDYKPSRYPLIGRLLGGPSRTVPPSLVLLQEAFDGEGLKRLVEAAGFPHQAAGPAPASLLGVGSGLHILSRYPILEHDSLAFGFPNCLRWDCLANKGVQFARVSVPGLPRPLDVFNTHLQAGRDDSNARRAQVKLLLEFFRKKHQPGNPVIFAGDFNFRPGQRQQSYLDFVSAGLFLHAGELCLKQGCFQGEDSGWQGVWQRAVDHQFFSKAGPVEIQPVLLERNYRDPVENHKLSDHTTHEVRYELRWREP